MQDLSVSFRAWRVGSSSRTVSVYWTEKCDMRYETEFARMGKVKSHGNNPHAADRLLPPPQTRLAPARHW